MQGYRFLTYDFSLSLSLFVILTLPYLPCYFPTRITQIIRIFALSRILTFTIDTYFNMQRVVKLKNLSGLHLPQEVGRRKHPKSTVQSEYIKETQAKKGGRSWEDGTIHTSRLSALHRSLALIPHLFISGRVMV
jgi:hypothetical protein